MGDRLLIVFTHMEPLSRMKPVSYSNDQAALFSIDGFHRWNIYRRLQELAIPCECSPYQPLQVSLLSPMMVVQLWSILRRETAPRHEQLTWLERCWKL